MLFYTITKFSLSYGTGELGLRNSTLLNATLISVAILGVADPVFADPVFATLSDKLGRRNLCMEGALMALISLLCLFFLSETHLTDISGMREEERDLLAEEGVVPK